MILKKLKDKEQPDKIRKFFCKFCGKEVNPNEEKCEECSTRLKIKDRENREVDEFFASLSEK